jgi:cytochrome oxidase assembly protein ShyY1
VNVVRARRKLLLPTLFALLGLAALFALGVWQIERKTWKEALIAALAQRTAAAPVALPSRDVWPTLNRDNFEFTRVRLWIEPAGGVDAFVFTSGSALRADVKSPGYFVFTPARLADGAVVVINRGYAASPSAPPLQGPQEIVGSLRWPEQPSWLVSNRGASGIWHIRDPLLMARALNWGDVAPFYIEQEAPVPSGGVPHPAPLHVRLRNDHLQYALTWFGLAGTLIVVFAVWAAKQRREPVLDEFVGH